MSEAGKRSPRFESTPMSISPQILAKASRVSFFAAAFSAAASASAYTFQDVVNPGDPTFNQELGINNGGTVVGYFGSGAPSVTPPPFTLNPNQGYTVAPPYTASSFTAENFPSSAQTQVTGLNNTGTTVGFYADSNGATTPNFIGFVDKSGTFTSVINPFTPAAPNTNQLLGVNDSNIAVGFYIDGNGNAQAYEYNIGALTFTPIALPSADDAVMTTATGINDSGEISGFFENASGVTEGFLDNSGTFSTFGVPGSSSTMFLGINNDGEAVGTYQDSNGFNNGLVYSIGTGTYQTVDDPNAVAANGGTVVNGLNDKGDLVGFYGDANGNTIGFVAATVPDAGSPASLGLGILGLCAFGGLLGRRLPSSAQT
jgi:hypothetical protein